MKISMIGSGYVGLVSGACLADFGHQVICVDKDQAKIDALRQGHMPIYEPGLSELVAKNVQQDLLSFTADLKVAVKEADAVFIAVGTPSRRGGGHADLSYVYAAAEEIASAIDGFTVIVTKSTVPVGTGDEVEAIIRKFRPDAAFAVVSNPEFLREGAAINDFKHPDRIVIGTSDKRAKAVMSEVYRPLYLNQAPLLFTDRRTSELIKYAGNAFLATKITFINEIADLCEKVGANVQEVARGIGLDNRIGSKFLNAGPGYGGSCFPKDTLALIRTAQEYDSPVRIVETVAEVNEQRKHSLVERVVSACEGEVKGKTIGLLGLAFKPNTDDLREAPALSLIESLHQRGADIIAFDPQAMAHAKPLLPTIRFGNNAYDCAKNADALVFITEWEAFRALDLSRLRQLMRQPTIVDLRNIYRPEEMMRLGFQYVSIGRPTIEK